MIRTATDWFEANPNAYLAIMAVYAAAAPTYAFVTGKIDALGMIVGLYVAVALLGAVPAGGKAEKAQSAVDERRYRFAKVAVYPAAAALLVAGAVALGAQGIGLGWALAFFGSFSAMNIGSHIRFRWLQKSGGELA